MREDTVGQLRDAVKFELDRLQNPVLDAGTKDSKLHGARTFTYSNLRFEGFAFDDLKGLEFAVSFDQPFNFSTKSEHQREQIWQYSKRLGQDALVCLIDNANTATFLIVSAPPMAPNDAGVKVQYSHSLHTKHTRHLDPLRASAILRFVEHNKDTPKQVISFFDRHNSRAHMVLVEFLGVLVPAFQPTLTALQKMSGTLDLPFSDLILQTSTGSDKTSTIAPPEYATEPGFTFDLKSIAKSEKIQLQVEADGNLKDFDMDAFKQSTSLDSGQADALISSLSRSFAVTQGPPGTGKSYTGIALVKVLLDNKSQAQLGPLLLISYTNHALDQLLEHLLDGNVKQIIRIGSRSKSERLTELNLRVVAQKTSITKNERAERHRIRGEIKREGRAMSETLAQISEVGHQSGIRNYLAQAHPIHFAQLFELVESDGFETVDHDSDSRLHRWRQGALFPPLSNTTPARTVEELAESNLQLSSLIERDVLFRHWCTEIRHELQEDLTKSLESYYELKEQHDLIRTEMELRTLQTANIIGVTTSGLARNLALLRKLPSKVLISEEAGEVQESHLLTALLPSLEHVILIGDHLQLRPQVQNYNLSSESKEGQQYCLDISLFERLVKPLTSIAQPIPFSTLEIQRRMHPSIAELVRSTLYPTLQDASNVGGYPEVSGMRRRLFWLDHERHEDVQDPSLHSTSKTNDLEADMTAALVRHLVRQGLYKPSDIAVLTPYLGQLRKLRDKLRSFYEITLSEGDAMDVGEIARVAEESEENEEAPSSNKAEANGRTPNPNVVKRMLMQAVRLSTIDNFQGEEATVVIISLVRCNEARNPGFPRTENRCNVLLSRAKHGMYIIGNAETAGVVPMWANVLNQLQLNGNLGNKLELCCPRHPDKSLEAAEPEELHQLAPAGGCNSFCGRSLPFCGHSCPEFCHADILHQVSDALARLIIMISLRGIC